MNVSEANSPIKVTIYNVSLSPMAQRQLIGTDFGELELKGTVQLSRSVSGGGLSRYYKEEHAKCLKIVSQVSMYYILVIYELCSLHNRQNHDRFPSHSNR